MLRIAICDDEVRAREALYLQLEKLLWEGEEIVYEFSSGKAAAGWIENIREKLTCYSWISKWTG